MNKVRSLVKSTRAISPAIATILLIALSVVAAVSVSVVLQSIDMNNQGYDTSGALIGANSSVTAANDVSVSISINKLAYNLQIFAEENKKYYTRIEVNVNYTGSPLNPDYIYVMDFDIYVYGLKLDDISPWKISTANGADPQFDSNGNFVGYQQAKNTTATYKIELEDISKKDARIFEANSFVYEVKFGLTPGIITNTVSKEELSKVVFNTVMYNVSIVHYGQDKTDPNSALAYWIDAINYQNGSNKLYFRFNEASDIYDSSAGDLNGLNMTWFTTYYQLVIFAEWAVVKEESTFAKIVHEAGIPLLFGGTITFFDRSGAGALQVINSTAQEEITGLTPASYTGRRERSSSNYYSFNTSSSPLVLGISGATEDPYLDEYGFDAVDLAPNSKADTYGTAHIELYDRRGRLKYNHTGPMLTKVDANITTGEGMVITYVIQHTLATYSQTVFRNIIFSAFKDDDRIRLTKASLSIDSWVKNVSSRNDAFNIQIQLSVINGDIKNNTLTYTLNMDRDIRWRGTSYTASVIIGTTVISIPYTIDRGTEFDQIYLDIGSHYNGNIVEGTVIKISLPDSGNMRLRRSDSNLDSGYAWINKFEWLSLDDSYGSKSETYN